MAVPGPSAGVVDRADRRARRLVFGWLFLLAFLWVAWLGLRLPFEAILSLLMPEANWLLGRMPAVPLVESCLALLLVIWAPQAFGLRLGNHRRLWWMYVVYVAVCVVYGLLRPYLLRAHVLQTIGQPSGPSTYLLTPFREELLFRGFMYGVLVEMYPASEGSGRWISKPVLITAILFGLWHLGGVSDVGWGWGLLHVVITFAGGLVLGVIRRRSGSVLGPFLIHAVGNFVVGL